jgi:hypothetical protein
VRISTDFCYDICLDYGLPISLGCRGCCERSCEAEIGGTERLVSLRSYHIIGVNDVGRGRAG